MNKERRSRLYEVADIIDDAIVEIEDIIDEEQEALDNLPENLMYSQRADDMSEAIFSMEDIVTSMENVKAQLIAFK